jgi:hypothetical protein
MGGQAIAARRVTYPELPSVLQRTELIRLIVLGGILVWGHN